MATQNDEDRPAPPEPPPRSLAAVALCVLATVLLVGADYGTKEWAKEALSTERFGEPPPVCEPDEYGRAPRQRVPTEPVVLIESLFEFRYAENCGAAFGLLRSAGPLVRKAVFGVAATLAIIVLFLMFMRGRGRLLFAISVPLIVSGAIGNLIDRVAYGYVVDFIQVYLASWEYPTFNIADCGISVGVALLIIDGFMEGRDKSAGIAASTKGVEPQGGEPIAADTD